MNCPKCNADLPEAAAFCWACGRKLAGERKHRKRSNGTGSITKLSGNRQRPWLARKSGIIVGTYPTRTEAQKALERLTDTEVNEKFNMTMQQIYDLWLPEHSRTISESQKTNYRTAMKHCAPLHDRRWRSLRTSDFQSIIITMEQKGMSKSSCEKVLQLFGQLSDWAIREGIAQTNYAQFCTIVAVQKSEGIVLLPETITAIQQSTLPAADVALILLATGCRGNELFGALTGNCSSTYFIGGSKTDSGKNRVIPVAPIGLEAYQKFLRIAKEKKYKYLIEAYEGNKVYANFAKRDFKELVAQTAQQFTPYDCRHTFATQAKRSGIDPQNLRRILGHANLSTTDKYYTHMDLNDLLAASQQIDLKIAVGNRCVTRSKQGQQNTPEKLVK